MSSADKPRNRKGFLFETKEEFISAHLRSGAYDDESIDSLHQEWEEYCKQDCFHNHVDRMVEATPYDVTDTLHIIGDKFQDIEEVECKSIPGLTLWKGVK